MLETQELCIAGMRIVRISLDFLSAWKKSAFFFLQSAKIKRANLNIWRNDLRYLSFPEFRRIVHKPLPPQQLFRIFVKRLFTFLILAALFSEMDWHSTVGLFSFWWICLLDRSGSIMKVTVNYHNDKTNLIKAEIPQEPDVSKPLSIICWVLSIELNCSGWSKRRLQLC